VFKIYKKVLDCINVIGSDRLADTGVKKSKIYQTVGLIPVDALSSLTPEKDINI